MLLVRLIQGLSDFITLKLHFRWFTREGINRYQERKVLGLLKYVRRYSPFYQDLYKEFGEISNLEDFSRLPAINKHVMMDHFDTLNTANLKKETVMEYALKKESARDYLGYCQDRFVAGLSSGTSGNKGLFVTPRELTARLPFVFLARGGIPLRLLPFRILFLLRVFSQGFDDIRSPFIHLRYMETMTPVGEIIKCLNGDRTNVLMAPPSLLRQLMPYASSIIARLGIICTYAEVLEQEEKRRFENIFRTKVVEIYQASEGQVASACRFGNLHINEDLVYVELFDCDGKPMTPPPGDEPTWSTVGSGPVCGPVCGRMILTNLVNRLQPLIRYEMNDLLVLGGRCPCGSRFRIIRKIVGRNDDLLYLCDTDGNIRTVFPDLVSRWIITTSDAIREFRVVQGSPNAVEVIVDLMPKVTEAVAADTLPAFTQGLAVLIKLKERLSREFDSYGFRPEISVFEDNLPIPADRSKYKRFIRKCQ